MGRGLAVFNKEIVVFQQQHEDFTLEAFVSQDGKAGDYVISDNIGHYIVSKDRFENGTEYKMLVENASGIQIDAWAGLNIDDIEEASTEAALEAGTYDPDYINPYKIENSEDESKSA